MLNIFNVVPLIRKLFNSPPDLKTLNNLFSLVFEFVTAPTTAISIELCSSIGLIHNEHHVGFLIVMQISQLCYARGQTLEKIKANY